MVRAGDVVAGMPLCQNRASLTELVVLLIAVSCSGAQVSTVPFVAPAACMTSREPSLSKSASRGCQFQPPLDRPRSSLALR